MLKVSELRIGNLVEFCNHIQPTRIVTLTPRWLSSSMENGNFELGGYWYPIKITEEWLLKVGFRKNFRMDVGGYKKTPVWSLYSFSITIWDDGRLFYDYIGGNIEIKYVHQLQNIYFALTGKELEVKLQ